VKEHNFLGYKTHEHFVLEERMQKPLKRYKEFLNELLAQSKTRSRKRVFQQLTGFRQRIKTELKQLQNGMHSYLHAEKLKQKTNSI